MGEGMQPLHPTSTGGEREPDEGDLVAAVELELPQDGVHVRLHRRLTEEQPAGDLAVGEPALGELGDDELARCQSRRDLAPPLERHPRRLGTPLQCLEQHGGDPRAARRLPASGQPDRSQHVAERLVRVDEAGEAGLGSPYDRLGLALPGGDADPHEPRRGRRTAQRAHQRHDAVEGEVQERDRGLPGNHARQRLRPARDSGQELEVGLGVDGHGERLAIRPHRGDQHEVDHDASRRWRVTKPLSGLGGASEPTPRWAGRSSWAVSHTRGRVPGVVPRRVQAMRIDYPAAAHDPPERRGSILDERPTSD